MGISELKVKYHNDMNAISTKNLNEVDLNVFMALCAKAKDKNISEIELSFDEFIEASGLEKKSTVNTRKKIIDFIDSRYSKFSILEYKKKSDKGLIRFYLVNRLYVPEDENVVRMRIDEDFLYILNTNKNFTKFLLSDFVDLKGKYAKNLYRLLVQYDDTGWADFTLSDFKEYMGIPSGYRPKDITEKVIKPSIEELKAKKLFNEINYEVKKARNRGAEVKGYHFNFTVAVNDDMNGQLDIFTYMDENGKQQFRNKKKNSFNNFPQNTYDFKELEEKLLDN